MTKLVDPRLHRFHAIAARKSFQHKQLVAA